MTMWTRFSEGMRQFPIIRDVEKQQIRELADFQRSDAAGAAEGMSAVNGSGGNGFSRRKTHAPAGQGHGGLHAQQRSLMGVEVGGEGDRRSGLDEGAGPRVAFVRMK